MSVTLAVDAMGGDHGLVVTVPASLDLLGMIPDLQIRLVGDAARSRSPSVKQAQN